MGVIIPSSPQQSTARDISLTLQRHPVTGDIAGLNESQAIRTSIINIVSTSPGELAFRGDFGSRLKRFLFEPLTPIAATAIQSEVITVLQNKEPRIIVRDVEIYPDETEQGLMIRVIYTIRNDAYNTPQSATVELLRTT